MDFSTLLWFFLGVWLVSCIYYAWKISLLLKSKGVSIFSLSKLSSTSRTRLQKLFLNIVLSTVIFMLVVLIAYFVSRSS